MSQHETSTGYSRGFSARNPAHGSGSLLATSTSWRTPASFSPVQGRCSSAGAAVGGRTRRKFGHRCEDRDDAVGCLRQAFLADGEADPQVPGGPNTSPPGTTATGASSSSHAASSAVVVARPSPRTARTSWNANMPPAGVGQDTPGTCSSRPTTTSRADGVAPCGDWVSDRLLARSIPRSRLSA